MSGKTMRRSLDVQLNRLETANKTINKVEALISLVPGAKTESRGGQGGNESEGNVTGSATVRIIRPGESSGAPAKLERTPTLNNEAVIRLVEAGFSEGTIIKRIEESPVEFDLSPNKLEELHKRRVTDPIIAAMTTAMSDGPAKPEFERKN
jgi:hypothetical protein